MTYSTMTGEIVWWYGAPLERIGRVARTGTAEIEMPSRMEAPQ
jgi:hypothetical protein